MEKTSIMFLVAIILVVSSNFIKKIESAKNFPNLPEFQRQFPSREGDGCKSPESSQSLLYSRPMDCEEVRRYGNNVSGIYTIYPRNRIFASNSLQVYCDMTTSGGGWTVLQRRGDYGFPDDYFGKTWDYYKKGFGALEQEFWLGNQNIFVLTNQASYTVRFDLVHMNGTTAFAVYDDFWIENEEHEFKLHINDYSGTAGDSMALHNNLIFSTKDRDAYAYYMCAKKMDSAWWFPSSCTFHSNLNGINRKGAYTASSPDGIEWYTFSSNYYNSLKACEIKIRPNNFV